MGWEVLTAALIAFTVTVSAVSGRNYLVPVLDFFHAHGKTVAVVTVFLSFLAFLLSQK